MAESKMPKRLDNLLLVTGQSPESYSTAADEEMSDTTSEDEEENDEEEEKENEEEEEEETKQEESNKPTEIETRSVRKRLKEMVLCDAEETQAKHEPEPEEENSNNSGGSGSSEGFLPHWEDSFPFEENLFLLAQHYEFVRRCATSKDAVVYQAFSKTTGDAVAIKISMESRKDKDKDLPKEIRILTVLQGHPSISKLHAWCLLPNTHCYAVVTEWLQNDEAEAVIFGHPDKARKVQIYMNHLLAAVKHMHEKNVLYRDVKPSNVLWNDTTERAILIDFDVATFFSKDRLHRRFVGTDGFIGPEVEALEKARKNGIKPTSKGYDMAVDVWGAGMVFGQLLFEFSESDVYDADFQSKASGPAFVKRALKSGVKENQAFDLLVKMLEPDPTKRITIDGAIEHPYFTKTT